MPMLYETVFDPNPSAVKNFRFNQQRGIAGAFHFSCTSQSTVSCLSAPALQTGHGYLTTTRGAGDIADAGVRCACVPLPV